MSETCMQQRSHGANVNGDRRESACLYLLRTFDGDPIWGPAALQGQILVALVLLDSSGQVIASANLSHSSSSLGLY